MNEHIFFILFNFANKNDKRKKITIFLTNFTYNIFFYSYFIVFIYLLYIRYDYKNLLKYLIIPIITFLTARLIRLGIKTKRPFVKFDINSLINHKENNSFPSNHSTSAMIIAFSIGYIFKILFLPFFILAIITGILRIMCGLHYPIDVLFGFLIGILFGYFGFYILY